MHSYALKALERLGSSGTATEWPPQADYRDHLDRHARKFEDPDADAMRDALEQVVRLLDPWRKTGRSVRSTCL